jgi:ubiquinone/menaquinone biosynthesis C-methylase UbiE
MAVGGKRQADETVARLNLDGVGRVIDIGGGPGIYAAAFAKALPDAEVFVLDQPDVEAIATEFIGDLIATGRVKYISGDALAIDDEKVIGRDGSGKYDIVFMSNLIHAMSPEQVKEVIARSVRWCRPGGRFICKDFFLDDTRTKPPRAALFAINMLVGTPGGNSYTWTEIESWLGKIRNAEGKPAVTEGARVVLSDGYSGMIVATIAG